MDPLMIGAFSQLGISDNFMFGLIMRELERCRRFGV